MIRLLRNLPARQQVKFAVWFINFAIFVAVLAFSLR
jgi:hypothetical protein